MQINLYAQNKLSRIEAVNWFESLDKNTKHNTLTRLYWYIINTSPTKEEIDISIANSGLKKTYTPIVLILKDNNPLPRILELPENEYKKSFILLLEVFKTADTRRRNEECKGLCTHEWHNIKLPIK